MSEGGAGVKTPEEQRMAEGVRVEKSGGGGVVDRLG